MTHPLKWKLVAFDWDGTLADTRQVAYQALRTVFEKYCLSPPSKEVFMENISSDEKMAFYYKHGIPMSATRKDLNTIWQQYFNDPQRLHEFSLRDGSKEVLHAFHNAGLKVSIVSGSGHAIITTGLTKFDLVDLVDHIEADACGKIDELYRTISRFSIDPKEAIYIDDTFEGLSAAKSVGLTAIGIMGGFNTQERLLTASPDYLIKSLYELLPIFGLSRSIQKKRFIL